MQDSERRKGQLLKLCIATFLCFGAVYLSEITLGAVSTIPFILILPGIAYFLYGKLSHIGGLCALAAFIVKCVFSSDIFEIVMFVIFCTALGTVSAWTFSCFRQLFTEKKKNKATVISAVLFVFSFVIYILICGTFWGNLTSKKVNLEYIEKTYKNQDILAGSTYYSFSDRSYVTEIGFTAKERYTALIGAKENSKTDKGFAKIDGYRDLMKREILNLGQKKIRASLSSFAYEGSDYVIRNSDVETGDVLTSKTAFINYLPYAKYEIALYYSFETGEAFEAMCRSYIEHLNKYPDVVYKTVTFYGFDSSESKDFAYSLSYEYGSNEFKSKKFDSSKYSRYFNEKDTHKYWELMG